MSARAATAREQVGQVTYYQEREGFVTVAVEQPGRDPITFPARDQGHAVCLVDLLKQGMLDREMG